LLYALTALLGVGARSVPDYTPALSTKRSFSFAAKLLREILTL
jgi:hypothetical protein